MTKKFRSKYIQTVLCALLFFPVTALAADFKVLWDPNCNQNPDLEGYTIYYKQDASVLEDPSEAFEIYVGLSDPEFNPDEPGYTVSDLLDGMRYCFTVTARYEDGESAMSNEVCGINGADPSDPDEPPTGNASTDDSSSKGCFLATLN